VDGYWLIGKERRVINAKYDLSLKEQIAAAEALVEHEEKIAKFLPSFPNQGRAEEITALRRQKMQQMANHCTPLSIVYFRQFAQRSGHVFGGR
jgi:hypothetical protein